MPIYFFGNIRLKHQRFSLHCNYFCRVCFILRGHSYSCEFKHIKCMCFYQTAERENRRFKVKIVQSRPTLCNPMDYTVHGILQARILEWVAFPFSRGSSQPRDWTQVSHIAGRFFTSWANREAQEYWSGEPIPSPVDLPDAGIKPRFPAFQADSLPTELSGKPDIGSCLW